MRGLMGQLETYGIVRLYELGGCVSGLRHAAGPPIDRAGARTRSLPCPTPTRPRMLCLQCQDRTTSQNKLQGAEPLPRGRMCFIWRAPRGRGHGSNGAGSLTYE